MSYSKQPDTISVVDSLVAQLVKIMERQSEIGKMTISHAVAEFFVAKRAERLSENTLNDYRVTLTRFTAFVGEDFCIGDVTPTHIRNFLGGLPVSKKTVLNAHVALSSLWTFAIRDGICTDHIPRRVTPPTPDRRVIKPFSKDEVKRLLAAIGPPVERNRAIILMLLDTGIRASELADMTIGSIEDTKISVIGKGDKERLIPLSRTTLLALLDYLHTRHGTNKKSPMFSVKSGATINRHTLRKWLERLGERAGVSNCHPHRFRHTFAINYLRNGGDAISLQALLGHSTLEMVLIYVDLADDDVVAIHGRASPVENWSL